jgi:DNA-binding protein HU-beta
MAKQDLVEHLSTTLDIPKTKANEAIDLLLGKVTEQLITNGEVIFQGFGSFKLRDAPARTARNPRTGATLEIAASKRVIFKASPLLKATVQPQKPAVAEKGRRKKAA